MIFFSKRFTVILFYFTYLLTGTANPLKQDSEFMDNSRGDTLWIYDNMIISEGQTLQLSAGTVVLFDGPWYIEIRGKLVAEGNEWAPIVFKPADTLGFSDTLEPRGSWHGLRFIGPTNEQSLLRHCHFIYAKALDADSLLKCGGAVHAKGNVSVTFENCVFHSNRAWSRGGAVALFDGANLRFIDCIFQNNATYNPSEGYGGGVYVWNANPTFINCKFIDNQAVWTGGGICMYYANPFIHNCTFTGNFGYIGGGMAFYHCTPLRTICNNLIYGNHGLYFGGGISCNKTSTPVFVNNTIVSNMAIYGGGVYCNDSSSPTIYNTLIYNNINLSGLGPVYIWDPLSHPNFHYCNIQGGSAAFAGSGGGVGYWGNYTHNIDIQPVFDSSVSWLFYPLDTTLVDRGTSATDTLGLLLPPYDFTGSSRFVNGRVDIGAYERSGVGAISLSKAFALSIFPNPVMDQLNITIPYVPAGSIVVEIFNGQGHKILTHLQQHKGGTWNFVLDVRSFHFGVYYVRVFGKGWSGAASMIKE